MFGLQMTGMQREAYWGARAIFKPHTAYPIDLLPDRQSADGDMEKRKELLAWLNGRGMDRLKAELKKEHISAESTKTVEVREYKYILRACPNGSYGYLYIGAVMLPFKTETHHNTASKTDETVFVFEDNLRLAWGAKWSVPPIGQKGMIRVNDIGPAKLVGYKHEKYVDGLMILCPVVEIDKPPKWMIEQHYYDAVDRAEKLGEKKPLKKDFKLGPISVYDGDFKPE